VKYAVVRQRYLPADIPVVEIAVGGLHYINPKPLPPRYRGEGMEYDDPLEAALAAIEVCKKWHQEEPKAKIAIGSTYGFTLTNPTFTYKGVLAWAEAEKKRNTNK